MTLLQNEIFAVTLNEKQGVFDIGVRNKELPSISGARMSVVYWWKGNRYTNLLGGWDGCVCETVKRKTVEHGEIDEVRISIPEDIRGIAYLITFGLVQEYPLVLWKIDVINQGADPVNIEKIELLNLESRRGGTIHYPRADSVKDLGFFSNGWQSWSPARWYDAQSRMQISGLGFLQHPMIYNTGTPLPRRKSVFSSDMFAVIGDRVALSGFLMGFLSQENHFGSIEMDFKRGNLKMWANGDNARVDLERSVSTDWAVFTPVLLDHREPLEKYLEAVGRQNHVRVPAESPVGWCSWYHFYTKVTAKDVEENLKTIVDQQETLPIQLVQIDDGFESQIGDWFTFKSTFPDGVAPLAQKINREGLIPGLWLAPFILHPKAEVARNHPEWLLRKRNGRPVNAGFVWNTLTTALDLTVPEALAYVCQVISTAAKEWGYPYLKLDFLYAAALNGVYQDPTKTRAQVLRDSMIAIRLAVGEDVTLLGCGAPFGSMLGLVDAMRIGADVSGDWHPKFNGIGAFIKNEPSFPCAKNSIRNILTRANLHGLWWVNDPDCLLIRPETNLTDAEVQSLASSIALTGGSLLLSDDLPNLPRERLRIAEALLPVIGERARVIDWFESEMPAKLRLDELNETGEWHILGLFNWKEHSRDLEIRPADFHLNEGDYFAREFWSGRIARFNEEKPMLIPAVAAHGCALLSVRCADPKHVTYIGSNLHFSQGVEVAQWRVSGDSLEFTMRLPRTSSGEVFLHIPGGAVEVVVNGRSTEMKDLGDGFFSLSVDVQGFANIRIR